MAVFKSFRQGGERYENILRQGGEKLISAFEDGIFINAQTVWDRLAAASCFDYIDLTEIFGVRMAEINVEIGIGNGDFIVHNAVSGGYWLGFEPVKEFFMKAVNKVKREGLANVRLFQFDAETFIRLFPPKSINSFYINFPDPWPKRRHNKRRLLKTWFLELLRDKLAPGGSVIVLTDHGGYAEEILENFSEAKGLVSALPQGYSNNADGHYRTKYFKKFAERGNVYYFNYKSESI
jgi:tRNA (guanine-N7-)-methyltransferase